MLIAFYCNVYPQSLIIRAWTRQQGQPFAEVPSHCAMLFPEFDTVIECCIVRGVCARELRDGDYHRVIRVDVPDEAQAFQWLNDQMGKGYDLTAYAADVFARSIPTLAIRTLDNDRFTCSRLIAEALGKGGVEMPEPRIPYAPNDLLLTLRKKEVACGR